MEIRKILVISFEGESAMTEKKYFNHFKTNKELAFSLFSTDIIRFQSHRLEKSANYAKAIPQWLRTISNVHTYDVYIIIDNDKLETIKLFLEHLPNIRKAIIDAMGDRCDINLITISYLPLPEGKAFEYFLRLHYENYNGNIDDHNFIKSRLGEKFKKESDDYPKRLWKQSSPEILICNLKKVKCSYLQIFAKKD